MIRLQTGSNGVLSRWENPNNNLNPNDNVIKNYNNNIPSSIRLMDNIQFRLAQVFKEEKKLSYQNYNFHKNIMKEKNKILKKIVNGQ